MKKNNYRILNFLGFYPSILINNVRGLSWFLKDLSAFKKEARESREFPAVTINPKLREKYAESGYTSGHYFQQDLYVAQRIFESRPQKHVDIGSRIDGFVAHVAAFREIEVFDIRPSSEKIENIKFIRADFMKHDENLKDYTDSISSLHAIEHFGLGRYNDIIDFSGHVKGLENIYNVLKKEGRFYFSTPIGKQRIEFNAHRVFSMRYLLSLFENRYEINSFSYIDDESIFHKNAELNADNIEKNFGASYGCGIFEMTKK